MGKIYIIRHGESQGNKEGLFRGRCDFPLTENGIQQAKSLSEELKEVPLKAIYSSPLKRAFDTARIVAEPHGLEVIIDEHFNNITLGEWEGKPKNEIKEKYPELWKIWITSPEKLKFPGMEPLDKVMERSVKRFYELAKKHKDECIAIVSHRAVIKPLLAGILEIKEPYFWKIHVDTASYSVIEYDEKRGYTLTLLNQTKHLKRFIREYY